MKRSTLVLNGILGVALVGAGTGAALAIGDPSSAAPPARTVRVTTGTVNATVTASGNLAASQIAVNFTGSGGLVTAIYVKPGQKVTAGQKLAAIDDTAARQSLASANASLAGANAQLETTTQGQTEQERARSEAAVKAAEVSVSNANTAVQQAKATRDLEAAQEAAKVSTAQTAVDAATTDEAKSQAQAALVQAQQERDASKLKNDQQVQNAQGQLASAQTQLSGQEASAAADAQPARAGQVASAEAQISNAKVQVAEAEKAVSDTVLKAPVAGTVTDLNGVVGQSSSTSGASSSTGSSSSSSGGSSSSTTSSSSSTTTGFITLSDLSRPSVTAMVAEADASKIKVGQKAVVTFSAASVTANGIVSSIDLQQTVTNNVVQYGVTVTLTDPNAALRIGQTASVSITTGTKSGVLTVPNNAITSVGPTSTVTVQKDGKNVTVPVTKGLVGDSATEVSGQLADGDTLVLPATGAPGGAGITLPGAGGLGGVAR